LPEPELRVGNTVPDSPVGDNHSIVRNFLNNYSVSQLDALASNPREYVLRKMSDTARREIYVAVEDVLDQISYRGPLKKRAGELAVYVEPHPGDEYRWQLAALFCDTVILRRPRWAPTFDFHSLRQTCLTDFESTHRRPPSAASTNLSAEDIAFIDSTLDDIEADSPSLTTADFVEWRDRVLVDTLANLIRFLIHLSAVGSYSRVLIADPHITAASDTLDSLKGLYWWNGGWHVCDEGWTQSPPIGVSTFSESLHNIKASWHSIEEVLHSYAVAPNSIGHYPIVPSNSDARAVAIEFYSRFHRLHFDTPLVGMAPQADLKDLPNDDADWRPTWYDEVLVSAFPSVSTANASAFDYLHNLPQIEEFRDDLRGWVRLDPSNIKQAQLLLEEVSYRMRRRAGAAADRLLDATKSSKSKVRRTRNTATVNLALGFITNPANPGNFWAAGRSISAAKRDFDPTSKLNATELALLTLAEGKIPGT
jgi:hypothetical protein